MHVRKIITRHDRCFSCKHEAWSYLYNSYDHMFGIPGLFSIYRCEHCGLTKISPSVSDATMKKYYPSNGYYSYSDIKKGNFFKSLRSFLINHYYRPNIISRLFSLLVKNVPAIPAFVQEGKVLDIGCGWGHTLDLLSKLGWKVYGLEIDAQAVQVAHSLGLGQVKIGGYTMLKGYRDSFFDAIRMYHVLEHVDYPDQCLSYIHKKLRAQGELIIGFPNAGGIVSKLFKKYWYGLDVPRHRYSFTVESLQMLIEQNGFIVSSVGYYSAGGILGSIQYYIVEKYKKRIPLVNNLLFMFLSYPFEWLFDLVGKGDICVIRARKE